MKSFLCSLLAVLLLHFGEAQDASTLNQSTATCNYSLSPQNVWSSICNPAGINEIKKLSVAALFQNHFFLKDISTQYLSAAFPLNKIICASTSLFRFGNNFYSKNELATAVSLKLSEKLYTGMQLHFQFVLQSEEKNKWYPFPELGFTYKVKDRITLSSCIKNFLPIDNQIIRTINEKQILQLGLSYCFDKKIQTHVQCIFSSEKYPTVAAAIDYHFSDKLYFGFNISSSAQPFHFGLAYQLHKIKINIDFAYHQQLGFSPMSSITL